MTLEAAPEPAHQMRGETDQAVIDRRGMLLPRAAGAAQTRGAQPSGHRVLLDRVALRAAGTHWNRSLSHADRVDAAWSAAAEALCSSGAAAEGVLLRAARDGITAAADRTRQFYGLSQASGYTEPSAGFAKYWGRAVEDRAGDFQYDRVPGATWHQPPLSGWEDAVVERIALRQVMAGISPAHRRVLRALAEHGDQEAAARALGTTYATYRSRLRAARAAFRVLWHEGETVPPLWGCDRKSYRRGEESKGTGVTATRLIGSRRRQRETRRREAAA